MTNRLYGGIGLLAALAACGPSHFDGGAIIEEDALTSPTSVTLWTEASPKNVVPFCFANFADQAAGTGMWSQQIAAFKALVDAEWRDRSGLQITWTDPCPTTGSTKFVKIRLRTGTGDMGGQANQGMAALRRASDPLLLQNGDPAPGVSIKWGTTTAINDPRFRYTVLHEIGHVLGFDHEHFHEDNVVDGDNDCLGLADDHPTEVWTTWDQDDTVMGGYCGLPQNGTLSALDIAGVRKVYGHPGRAIDLGVAEDIDHPWVIGTSGRVFRWSGSAWEVMREGDHIAIDVGTTMMGSTAYERPWVIDSSNAIWRYNGTTWDPYGGSAKDIGVSSNGTVRALWTDDTIRKHEGGQWVPLTLPTPGPYERLDVSNTGEIYATFYGLVVKAWPEFDLGLVVTGADDVSIGSDGTVWIANGQVQRKTSTGWADEQTSTNDRARVAGGPRGTVGSLGSDDRIYVDSSYKPWSGSAIDISIGDRSDRPWLIGTSGRVYQWTGATWTERRSTPDAIALDVCGDGTAYAVDSAKRIFRRTQSTWSQLVGRALDVGCGATSGDAWVIGTSKRASFWNGTGWQLDNTLTRADLKAIDVGPNGPVVVAEDTSILRRVSGTWTPMSGGAIDVGVGGDGKIFVIGSNSQGRFFWNGSSFQRFSGAMMERITAGPDGRVGSVDWNDRIFVHTP